MATKTKTKTKTKTSSVPAAFTAAGAAEAQARYGPEIDALKVIVQNAQAQHDQAVHNARVGAQIISAAAGKANAALPAQFAAARAPLPGQPAPAAGAEADLAAHNLGLSQGAITGLLAQEPIRAQEGAAYQVANADRTLNQATNQAGQQAAQLQGESGAYAASQIASMLSDQAKQDFTASQNQANRANQANIAAGNNRTSANNNLLTNETSQSNTQARITAAATAKQRAAQAKKNAANKGRLPGGAKQLGQPAQNALGSAVRLARQQVADYVNSVRYAYTDPKTGAVTPALNRAQINAQIAKGVPGYTQHELVTAKNGTQHWVVKIDPKTGIPATQPGIKPITQDLVRNVVLDQILYGGVTPVTVSKLHHAGYKVDQFGTILAAPTSKSDRLNRAGAS
jgi:hypothetical protein